MTVFHANVILLTLTCQLAPKSNSDISQSFVASVYKPAFFQCSTVQEFNFVQQCIQISTRINSSSVHMYIFVCFIRNISNIQQTAPLFLNTSRYEIWFMIGICNVTFVLNDDTLHNYHPIRILRKGNVLSRVCLSVHRRGLPYDRSHGTTPLPNPCTPTSTTWRPLPWPVQTCLLSKRMVGLWLKGLLVANVKIFCVAVMIKHWTSLNICGGFLDNHLTDWLIALNLQLKELLSPDLSLHGFSLKEWKFDQFRESDKSLNHQLGSI